MHTALFLLLTLWTMGLRSGDPPLFNFQFQAGVAVERPPAVEMVRLGDDAPAPPSPMPAEAFEPSAPAMGAERLGALLQVPDPSPAQAESTANLQHLLSASGVRLQAAFAGTGVEGRRPRDRQQVAMARGGTIESERAVEDALDWLARHQLPNGAWSLEHAGGACNGRCANNGSHERFDPAATGLSLLAFLGAGYTHQEGKHRETVRRGVYHLLQILEETPQGGSFLYQSDRGMYNHGIAAFALCEAYQLSGDEDLKRPAEQVVEFILSAQSYQGGWGYLPMKPGDLTLSAWQVMALKSGFAAGMDIPPATLTKLDLFLDSQTDAVGVTYGYRGPGDSTTCTAIGMLLRLFRGVGTSDPRILEGVAFLEQQGPSSDDAYFNYYSTLSLFHVGGLAWKNWNPRVREHLIDTQATEGHERGSWYFENPYGKEGGRLYTTAMSAMTLEVYYRFSPLYRQADAPFEL